MTPYRYDINIDKAYRFGTEIEFSNATLEKLNEIFLQENLNVTFKQKHKQQNPTYNTWYLDTECTISIETPTGIKGGELSSKILTNEKETWKELKKICTILKDNNAIIDDSCANHVNIDLLSEPKSKNDFYKLLMSLILLYEQDMELFYMGNNYHIRENKDYFAYSIKTILLKKLAQLNPFEQKDYYHLLTKEWPTLTESIYGIKIHEKNNQERFEIRYPRGTLDEKIIQNYINFSLKLINACIFPNQRIDKEKLTYLTNQEITSFLNNDFSIYRSKPNEFLDLIENISQTQKDIDDLSYQYKKVHHSWKKGQL